MIVSRLRSASFGIATAVVFLWGAVFAPTLHQTFHHADHIHVGDSIIFLDRDVAGSEAAHHDHHHDDGDDDADDDDHDHADDHQHDHHDDQDHGSTSLWHFGAALGDQVSVTPALVAIVLVETLPPAAYEPYVREDARAVPNLRGPPPRSNA